MKTKSLFLLLIALAVSTTTFSQGKLDKLFAETTAEDRARFQTDRMKEKLDLRADQEGAVYRLNLNYANKFEQTHKAGGGKLQRLKSMKALSDQKERELKTILDASQYALYEKMKDEMRESMKERNREKRKG